MVIATLLCALQVATTAPPPLSVLVGDRRKDVPVVVRTEGGLAVRADLLGAALGGEFVADGATKYHMQIATTRIDIEVGSAFARLNGETFPLVMPVYRIAKLVFVPIAFATELIPRVTTGVLYDSERREIRRFGDVVARRPAPAGETAPTNISPTNISPSRTLPAQNGPARKHIVVVDAGHGGVDRGMTGPIGSAKKVYEKDIVLAVAKELKAALEKRGITVIMTRKSDTLIALGDRGRIANQAKGDLFMSVHVNSANLRWPSPGNARGYETYFLAEAKTEDERRVAAMENESIKFETDADMTRNDPLGFIMRDMAQNEHLRESSRLATMVQEGLKTIHPGPSRGVKQAGFMVLNKAFMPAVLVEIGFGSNRTESAFMTSPENQRTLAETLADAAEKFLAQYERKVGGT